MKGPKFSKFEANKDDNNNYNFFQVGLFPERENAKLIKNKSSQKKNKRPSLSMPKNIYKNKIPNTQKDDDLLPFFAKDYPSSSESKEEICFINSPLPSNSDSGGEAEEVEGIEEEDKEEKTELTKEKVINNINNKEFNLSIDFNSELEAQMIEHSQYVSKDEVVESFNRMQNIKNMEKIRKEEEERKRKENEKKKEEEEKKRTENEKNKKEEEERKRKETEDRLKKEKKDKEKKEKLRNERIEKISEEEKNKQEEEEEQKKKEGKKKKLEKEKEKEKNENVNFLSSIKKNSDDKNSVTSTSMIKEVKQIFPDVIPEEKGESGEEEDYSKKNYKKNSKRNSKLSQKNNINEENRKSNLKDKNLNNFDEKSNKIKNKKYSSIHNDDNYEEDKKDSKKKKKKVKSKKSNGINIGKQNKFKYDEYEEEIEFSNYGDELKSSDSDGSKKTKIRVKEKIISKPQKKLNLKQKYPNLKADIILTLYKCIGDKIKIFPFEPNKNKKKIEGRRYSLRNRIPILRHELGERAHYIDRGNGPEIEYVDLASNSSFGYEEINASSRAQNQIEDIQKKLRKKKKLKKGGILEDEDEKIEEKSNENDEGEKENNYNSELLDSQKFSEYGEEDTIFLNIKKGGKKNSAKNYNTKLLIKIHEANGKNIIKVDKTLYSNLKSGDTVKVNRNQIYEILNFSEKDLIVQLIFDNDD